MGFAYNGTCYSGEVDALAAFKNSFPFNDGASLNYLSSASVASGVITYSVQSRQWSSNTLASRTGTATLTACTDDYKTPFDHAPIQDIGISGAFVICFGIGVMCGLVAGLRK